MSKRENASISFAMSSSVTFAIFVASLVYLTTELMHFRDSLSRHVLNKGGLDFCQIRTDLHPPFSHQCQFGYWFSIWVVKISVFLVKIKMLKRNHCILLIDPDQINFLFVANIVFQCYHFSKQFLSKVLFIGQFTRHNIHTRKVCPFFSFI